MKIHESSPEELRRLIMDIGTAFGYTKLVEELEHAEILTHADINTVMFSMPSGNAVYVTPTEIKIFTGDSLSQALIFDLKQIKILNMILKKNNLEL